MITDAANNYADALLAKAKQYDNYATVAATMYARSDNKSDQAAFKKNSELGDLFRKLHGEACQFLHAVESEMREKTLSEMEEKSARS